MGDEVAGQAQGAGAAGRLGGVGALLQQQRRGGAERQFRQARGEQRIAVAADVALGGFLLDQALLGEFHRAQDRGQALGILVDTDAEVQLVRARIVAVGVEQARIGSPGTRATLAK